MTPAEFIAQILTGAQACQRATGIPASFTIAQAALESSWGKDAAGNNLFGIKADRSWTGPTIAFRTTEHLGGKDVKLVDRFRAYDGWLSSMVDHAKFFQQNPRYHKCFLEKTGEGWARAVAAAGYATDPKYAEKLIAVMRGRNMAQYDAQPAGAK